MRSGAPLGEQKIARQSFWCFLTDNASGGLFDDRPWATADGNFSKFIPAQLRFPKLLILFSKNGKMLPCNIPDTSLLD
jgi:hypothetical protein